MSYAAGAAAVRAAAIARAIKASGAIINIPPQDFTSLVPRSNKPLVVMSRGGVIRKNYRYLTAYKGLTFFTKSRTPLPLPGDTELVTAQKIWIPD
ncbi:MAG: hypothetical protein PHU08_02520 [Dehalococcoidales bacterium]|nr:hypothetical protein [Dehalococcoidales bacterium]